MSGGSFNYLSSCAQVTYLAERRNDIASMAKWLHEGGYHDAAARTERVVALLAEASAVASELESVWHTAEWRASGDGSEESVAEAVTAWREANPLLPQRAEVSRRLHELEKHVAAEIAAIRGW
jgi:hypothetical protein